MAPATSPPIPTTSAATSSPPRPKPSPGALPGLGGHSEYLNSQVLRLTAICIVDFTWQAVYYSCMKQRDAVTNSVERYRRQLSLTQEELGDIVGVTRQTIIAIEKGNYVPSLLLAMKLAQQFNIRIEELFYYEAV